MKKVLMTVAALFALQNTLAWADDKPEHKGPDKQISVGNEKAAKSGATSDMKVVKEKENQGKDEEHPQTRAEGDDHKAKKDKKAKKMKKDKKAKG